MRGIADVGLVHDRASTNSSSVVLYILTIYAGDLDKRISLRGYVFTLFGCAINWKAMLQYVDSYFVYYRGKIYGNDKNSEGNFLIKGFGRLSWFATG